MGAMQYHIAPAVATVEEKSICLQFLPAITADRQGFQLPNPRRSDDY